MLALFGSGRAAGAHLLAVNLRRARWHLEFALLGPSRPGSKRQQKVDAGHSAPNAAPVTPCSLHTRTPAGWSCTGCHRTLCPDCTGWRGAGKNRIDICMRCGSLAKRLLVHRSQRDPLRSTLSGALAWPLSPGGIVTLIAVALVVHILELSGPVGRLVGAFVALAYLFKLVRHTAAGYDHVPTPGDFRGFFEDVVSPGARALLASIWFAAPLCVWFVASGHTLAELGPGAEPLHLTAFPLALLSCSALLFPMAILAGALGSPLSTLLNPFAVVNLALGLGGDYWLSSFFCLGCALGALLLRKMATLFFLRVHLPLDGFVITAVSLYLPFVAFRALGLLVRARGDALGFGGADSYRVPVLDKEPLHEVKAAEARPVELEPERSYAPIEIALASEPGQPKKPIPLQGPAESAAEMGTPEPLLPLDEPPAPDAGRAADAAVAKLAPAAAPPTDAAAVQPAVNAPNPAPAPAPAAPSPVSVPPERQAAMRLAQRMAARDPDGARLVMRAGAAEIPARTLSAQSWNELARAFVDDAGKAQGESRRELAQLAILCCRRGLEVAPDGALAPRNWLLAARVCDELLRDRPESDRLLGELAQRFPQTPEGAFALKRLKAMNPG